MGDATFFNIPPAMSVPNDVLMNPCGNDANTSLASCNPTRDVIPQCSHLKSKRTNAEVITAKAKGNLNKENAHVLQLEIGEFLEPRDGEILQLSKNTTSQRQTSRSSWAMKPSTEICVPHPFGMCWFMPKASK